MSDKEKRDALSAMYRDADGRKRASAPQKKKRKNAPVSLFHRPIVCPPDGAGKELRTRIIGYGARILLLLFTVFGFSFFIADAFYFHYTVEEISKRGEILYVDTTVTGTIFGVAVLAVLILSAVCLFRIVRRIAAGLSAAAVIGIGVAAILSPTLGGQLLAIPKTLVNCFLERLHRAHFLTMIPAFENAEAGLSEGFRVKAAAALLTVIVAAFLVPFLLRKTRIVVPAVFSTLILTFIFVCNLSRSNWAFALLLASFASVIVMAAYDKLYQGAPSAEEYDTTAELFPSEARPTLSQETLEAMNEKQVRRAEKKRKRDATRAKKKEKRAAKKQGITVDRELSEFYFSDRSSKKKERPAKAAKPRLTPEERKAEKTAKRNGIKAARMEQSEKKKRIRASVAAVRSYDRTVEDSRAAAGGLTAIVVFALLFLVLFLPAISVSGSFQTIPAIDEKLEYCREYITALLVGNEDVLDELEYEGDASNFRPRTSSLTDRYYDGTPLMYIRARSAQTLYMKEWIAVDFENDQWKAVDKESVEEYRSEYSFDDFPAEQIRSNFYRTIFANEVASPLAEDKNWYTDVHLASSYGTIVQMVSVERLSDRLGMSVLLPYSYMDDYGLRIFEGTEEQDLNFINYFDGILTGRDFLIKEDTEVSYSTLSYTTTMKYPYFMETISKGIAVYNANFTIYELYRDGYFTDPEVNPDVRREYDTAVTLTTAYYEPLDVTITTRHNSLKNQTEITVFTTEKTPDISLIKSYFTTMTKAEKKTVEEMFDGYSEYRSFVWETYRKPAVTVTEDGAEQRSAVLSALSKELSAEYADALQQLKAGGSLSAEAYEGLHAYILEILEYMKDNCVFLEPDEETLDIIIDRENLAEDASLGAIENFLTVTKQGYCVQYASALCLLLREQGIPARYVEGYIVSELAPDRSIRDTVYEGYVYDYNFHAWVEVWYDGIGWVQYEATTGDYYDRMYPVDKIDPPQSDEDDPIPPVGSGDEEEEEEEEEKKEMTDEEKQAYEEELRRKEMIKKLIRFAILLGSAALIGGVIFLIAFLAARSEKKRDLLIRRAKDGDYPDSERRFVALRLIDEATELLAIYGLSPLPGEMHVAYAHRLFEVMPTVFGVLPNIEGDDSITPASFSYEMDPEKLFLSIAAEEFGGGISRAEVKELAEYFSRLRTQKKRFVSPLRRFGLHYFRHKL